MEKSQNVVQVVAALIWRENRFMACRRPANKARALLWEFVGGKVEPYESKQQALARECKEELDIQVSVGSPVMTVTHEYPDIIIELTLFEAYILRGEPTLLEHCDLKWITREEIDQYSFCPADEVILEWLKQNQNRPITPAESMVQGRLFEVADSEYKQFHGKLVPTISQERIIGVRLPQVKKLARELTGTPEAESFMKMLPHRYYEENNLHGLLVAASKDYEKVIEELDLFLPYVDNWATCDSIRPRVFQKHPPELIDKIEEWIGSQDAFTIRFGIEMLMTYYLDEAFCPEYLKMAASVYSEEYYVQMMQAWYFATALAKQWAETLPWIQNQRLSNWVHNKTIQKAIESLRVPAEHKNLLRQLKIKV